MQPVQLQIVHKSPIIYENQNFYKLPEIVRGLHFTKTVTR